MVGKGKTSHGYKFINILDRTLVFGNKTSVNLHGEIVLGTGSIQIFKIVYGRKRG